MASATATETAIPPYVSYRTFINFVNEFRQTVPSRIDRSIMTNVAGSVQAQLKTALRYLGLTDENGRTLETFRNLARSEGETRKEVLRSIIEEGYPFLLRNGTFDLMTTTPAEFTEQFRNQGAKGDTIRKCELFFLNAAKDAGIPFSDRIEPKATAEQKASRPRTSTSRRSTKSINSGQVNAQPLPDNQGKAESHAHGRRSSDSLLADYVELRSFIGKLPTSKKWTSSKRERWLKALTSMIDWEIEIIDERAEEQGWSDDEE